MAFVNEYIPEADYEKYDLRRICGEHNLARQGHMHSNHWTVDRENEVFLIKVWSHHESRFDGWAFYWKSNWIFFERIVMEGGSTPTNGSCWYRYGIRQFVLPAGLEQKRGEIVSNLTRAFGDYCGGGVFSSYKQGTAMLEFIEESAR